MKLSNFPDSPLMGLLLRLLGQKYSQLVSAELSAAGFDDIGPHHANVFPFIRDEGIHVGELAALAGVRKQSMAQTVDELIEAGYLDRRPDPNDKRAKLLFLTEKGSAVRPIGKTTGQQIENHWAQLIGKEDFVSLKELMIRLLKKLRDEADSE